MPRAQGMSIRLKLALSYGAVLMLAGALLLAAVWVFLLRFVPEKALLINPDADLNGMFPVRSQLLRNFAPRAAAVWALLVLVGLGGGWVLAGRMLAPLDRLTAATRRASDGSLSHRVQLPGRRDEFRELADAFDRMLGQLEAHVAEQQRFAANASHELRSPLAIAQTILDVARNDPDRDIDELVERLHAVNSRAIELTEALLLLARADQRAFSREPVDLSLVAEEAGEALLAVAEQHGVTIEASGDVALTSGSPALLLQLATNLVHNAIVHNHPAHGAVWVTTGAGSCGVVLTVENTGAQVAPGLAATLVEPFQRGAQRRRSPTHPGVGLGLAIVNSITRAHDGTLTVTPRTGGGLRVTVRLPALQQKTLDGPAPSPNGGRIAGERRVRSVADRSSDRQHAQRLRRGA